MEKYERIIIKKQLEKPTVTDLGPGEEDSILNI